MIKFIVLFLLCASTASARDYIYHGTWVTTNRPLNGTMTCVLTPTAKHQYKGRFYGVWMGEYFDYTVNFSGPINNLKGSVPPERAISGGIYEWAGWVTKDQMRANFAGTYYGSFDLKRMKHLEKQK
jgi:hypothetical protein